jgi:hypothetical protein
LARLDPSSLCHPCPGEVQRRQALGRRWTFTEAKEPIAGFTIIQVKSLEEAIERVKRAPNHAPDGEAEVEA